MGEKGAGLPLFRTSLYFVMDSNPSAPKTPVPSPPLIQESSILPKEEGFGSLFSNRSFRAFIEIILCCGVPTSLAALFFLRILGVTGEAIQDQPLYLAAMIDLEAGLLLLVIYGLQKRRKGNLLGLGWPAAHRFGRETTIGALIVPFILISNLGTGFLFEKFLPQYRSNSNPLLDLIHTPVDLLMFFSMALFAGALKEEIQRAFILQRFRDGLGIPGWGLLFWSVAFGYGHALQGFDSAFSATFMGLILGLVYLWRRSLMAPILAHSVYNSMVLIGYWFAG